MIRIREGRLEVERNKGYDWLILCYVSLVYLNLKKGREWKGGNGRGWSAI